MVDVQPFSNTHLAQIRSPAETLVYNTVRIECEYAGGAAAAPLLGFSSPLHGENSNVCRQLLLTNTLSTAPNELRFIGAFMPLFPRSG